MYNLELTLEALDASLNDLFIESWASNQSCYIGKFVYV